MSTEYESGTIAENFMNLFFSPDKNEREWAVSIFPRLKESAKPEIRAQFPNINLDEHLEKYWRVKCGLCQYVKWNRRHGVNVWVYTCSKTEETLTEDKQKTGCRFFKDSGLPF